MEACASLQDVLLVYILRSGNLYRDSVACCALKSPCCPLFSLVTQSTPQLLTSLTILNCFTDEYFGYVCCGHPSSAPQRRPPANMYLTFVTDNGDGYPVEIDPGMGLGNVMALLEAEVGS